jgi:hypothetical protein
MAKRLDYTPEKPYTPEQLSEIRCNFAMLSKPSLQTAYSEALVRFRQACVRKIGHPPWGHFLMYFASSEFISTPTP